jgi:hypothetical protein
MYREKTTLQPVEYYNNLPYHSATTTSTQTTPSEIAILLDPIIATGATASAAIDTLRDWGVKRIVVCSVLASKEGLEKVSRVWEEGVQIWVGAVDPGTDAKGMIKPGLGDVGDRLFLTIGKWCRQILDEYFFYSLFLFDCWGFLYWMFVIAFYKLPSSHEWYASFVYFLSESQASASSQIFLSLAVTRLSGALATAA